MGVIETINIYKKTSLPRSKNGCNQYMHALEPTGIELLGATSVGITVTGTNVAGKLGICYHDVANLKTISTIDISLGTKVQISYPSACEIYFYVDGVNYTLNNDVPFSFTISLELDPTTYIVNPIFDIRANPISKKNNITDAITFVKKVKDPSNDNRGMVMISENARVHMPLSKYVPASFDPAAILKLFEDIIVLYNKLIGLNLSNTNINLQPRKQFLLITARTEQIGLASAGSTTMDTAPSTTSFYFGPGWGTFHEFGHMFEGRLSYVEVWTNMFSKSMADRTIGFGWLWGNDRVTYENNNIKALYDNYLIKNQNNLVDLGYGIALYFFLSLEQALGSDFIARTEKYARYNSITNGTSGFYYVIYSVAKTYGINVLPYGEIFGLYFNDQSVISDIIDSSTSTLLYVPENASFDSYRGISAPVTIKKFYAGTPTIQGMSNPNSLIKISVGTNVYTANTDNSAKFSFKIPQTVSVTDSIIITSKEPGKAESLKKTFFAINALSDNIITFRGLGDWQVAQLTFNVNKNTLQVSSMGTTSHVYFGANEYFGLQLLDSTGAVKFDKGVTGNENANAFRDALNNLSFSYGFYIVVRYKEKGRVLISNFGGSAIYNPKAASSEKYMITQNGLTLV